MIDIQIKEKFKPKNLKSSKDQKDESKLFSTVGAMQQKSVVAKAIVALEHRLRDLLR